MSGLIKFLIPCLWKNLYRRHSLMAIRIGGLQILSTFLPRRAQVYSLWWRPVSKLGLVPLLCILGLPTRKRKKYDRPHEFLCSGVCIYDVQNDE